MKLKSFLAGDSGNVVIGFPLCTDDAFQKLMCAMGRGDAVIGCALLVVPGRLLFSHHRSGLLCFLSRRTAMEQGKSNCLCSDCSRYGMMWIDHQFQG